MGRRWIWSNQPRAQLPDPKTYDRVGEVVSYTYVITGRSKLPLRGPVTITDTVRDENIRVSCPEVNTIGNQDNYLDWDEKISCTATYSIIQPDLDKGSVTNTATARVGDVVAGPVTVTITGIQKRSISLGKVADPLTYETVGQQIKYTYTITNSGNVTLKPPFKITDDHIKNGAPFICGNDNQPLPPDPNLKITCTMTYTIRDDDFHAEFMPKSVTNTAIASVNSITSAPATVTITCGPPVDWVPYTVQDELQGNRI